MHEIHTLAEHGRWVREQIADALREAADPATEWVDNATVEADADAQIARLQARIDNDE